MQLENHLMLWPVLILRLLIFFISTEANQTAFETFVNEFKDEKTRKEYGDWLYRLPWTWVKFYCEKFNFEYNNVSKTQWYQVEGADFSIAAFGCGFKNYLVFSQTRDFYEISIDENFHVHIECILLSNPGDIIFIKEENRLAYPAPLP